MECVVFDTSFLLNAVRARVDFLKEIREELGKFNPVLTSPVVRELERLAGKRKEARVALQLVDRESVIIVESELEADPSVVDVALKGGCLVASTDGEVRRAAKAEGLRLVTLRKGKRVVL